MCEKHDPTCPRKGDEYVQAVLDLRRGSRTRPEGTLRGRNRQNERRAAIERSRKENR